MSDSSDGETSGSDELAATRQNTRPAFWFSLIYGLGLESAIINLLIFFLSLAGAFLLAFVLIGDLVELEIVEACLGLVSVTTLIGAIRLVFQDMRSASFYEDYFEFEEWGTRRRIAYADIERLSEEHLPLSQTFPVPRLRNRIHLHLREEQEELVIPVNPRSGLLETDLFSWLNGKANSG